MTAFGSRTPIKLVIADFLLLRDAGRWRDHWRPELLDGALFASPSPGGAEPESDALRPYKLRIEDYELLATSGSIGAHPRTELIDGRIFAVSLQYRPHGFVKDELAHCLRRALEQLGLVLAVATEQSVVIPPHNEPLPDIIVTSEPQGAGGIPNASVALIVEVSTMTLAFDLGEKAQIYAEAGVPEYWVADVDAGVIHQHWAPCGSGYAERREIDFGGVIEAVTIPLLSIETAEL